MGALFDPQPRGPKPFGKAFALARAQGKPTFEWQGQLYTTELAPDADPATIEAMDVPPTFEGKVPAPFGDSVLAIEQPQPDMGYTRGPRSSLLDQIGADAMPRRASMTEEVDRFSAKPATTIWEHLFR